MRECRRGFHGLEQSIRAFSGARGVRVIHPCSQAIGEHRHDWPFLTIPALGGYVEHYDGVEACITGPSAVLHPAGTCHANCVGEHGMETISIEFDPDWLKAVGFTDSLDRSRSWIGGPVAAAARRLSAAWNNSSLSEIEVAGETCAFLRFALSSGEQEKPRWLGQVERLIDGEDSTSTHEMAKHLDLHPAWLARVYRSAVGEGLHETVRRKRVERAMFLLRSTDTPPAEIASAAGFCDQSHMNRGIKLLAGRTPLEVRAERTLLAHFASLAA